MNKKLNQLVPLIFLLAVIIFFALIYTMVKKSFDDYNTAIANAKQAQEEMKNKEKEATEAEAKHAQEEMKLKSIKQIYQTNVDSSIAGLSIYGNMFEDIIQRAQTNNLLIRSIEYDLRPSYDPIFASFSNIYNACELKLYLVGNYTQLRSFLIEMNNNFPYLMSISKLDVTAFAANTDYILIKLSITLYSKRKEGDSGMNELTQNNDEENLNPEGGINNEGTDINTMPIE